MNAKTVYEMTPGFGEAWRCGPLSIAIVRNRVDQVDELLGRKTDLLDERDMYGQSPLHLAANKPRILELLLQHSDEDLLHDRDVYDLTTYFSPLVVMCGCGRTVWR
ncbi:hypothetical protein Cob_v003354 [Colletotrichum orbiculare MAFF 240422]|uniref:Uncharacterized protein n=1 Tax=Colletotrichum orbiculare (strain 104-T / ATCC 96160 / CBS 514.97 / LARS 414 / MAFF 240422) TaxID=1213857 RepID=A0A484G361_COLOR|nr:hypothetical protein Cob_v003354 [Colletotrichum orbiculare MAFF 240422]